METIKEIETLLKEAEAEKFARYGSDWQARAVACANNYYYEHEQYDEIIYDTSNDEWDELVKQQLETRGWQGVLFFLGKIEPLTDYAMLDGYGNAIEVTGDDIAGALKDIKEEIERE